MNLKYYKINVEEMFCNIKVEIVDTKKYRFFAGNLTGLLTG